MRAVITDGAGGVELGGVEEPSLSGLAPDGSALADHAVVLRVRMAGLCGSDLHVVDDPRVAAGTVIGHEAVGEVVEVGREVSRLRVGDVAVAPFNVSCGFCANCARALTTHCLRANPPRAGATFGMAMGWPGLQAELAVIPWADHNLVRPPPSDQHSASWLRQLVLATDVVPTALHAVARAAIGAGDSVYVAGAGPIGFAVALAARHQQATVVVGEPNPTRAALVRETGIAVIDPTAGSLGELLRDAALNDVDCAIDCVGVNASSAERALGAGRTLDAILDVVRPGGRIVVPGVYPGHLPAVPVRLGSIWSKALTIAAGATPARCYLERAIELLATAEQPFAPLTPAGYPLGDAVGAYADFRAGRLTKAALASTGS